ncbi:VOC family protein [Stenotrophomonas sp. ISL-67]|uniref:VOC family protein n=1 Tax=Stenotrophomonas sp. ISL-67 TaxID=2819171 RepID=UPI001BE83B92|nr:VOC family protein [Stenotrophomonas sp. ISL-67]MBT2767149.1 VOC family protein [Stenotrophomonas sp. ISL-67]
MQIQTLQLPVSDVAQVGRYFAEVLQLPVQKDVVRIGWTDVQLRPAGNNPIGGVHLAFNVPADRFQAATDWLLARTPLQRSAAGEAHFTFGGRWDSESIYFDGPDGLILELIGRRRLPASGRVGGFHGSEMTCVSEVGLPTADVAALGARAEAAFGLGYLSPPVPHFAALGDDEGLLIVVDATRRWFPEQKVLPNARGIVVTLDDVGAGELDDAEQGWRVGARIHATPVHLLPAGT